MEVPSESVLRGETKMQKGQEKTRKNFLLPLIEISEISLEAIQALSGSVLPSL